MSFQRGKLIYQKLENKEEFEVSEKQKINKVRIFRR